MVVDRFLIRRRIGVDPQVHDFLECGGLTPLLLHRDFGVLKVRCPPPLG
jgi:hypothetical protein